MAGRLRRARAQLARTLAETPPDHRAGFQDVLPQIDALLADQLPRLQVEARFLRRYLQRQDAGELRREARHWERALAEADEPGLRAVRRRNLELAQTQLQRVEQLSAVLQRYEDQVAGLVLAIDEAAGRIAAARTGHAPDLAPDLARLRQDIDALATELADLREVL